MLTGERPTDVKYMHWAKTVPSGLRYNLAQSGVPFDREWNQRVKFPDLLLTGHNAYGYGPLVEEISARYTIDAERVLITLGSSMANFLTMAVLLEAGDLVWVEHPGYEPLAAVPAWLGARVEPVPRSEADGSWYDLDETVARIRRDRPRMVVISNLHNPSGALTTLGEAERLLSALDEVDGYLFCDEVYMEFLPPPRREHMHLLSPGVVCTNSLTKVYGFGSLRVGWALGPAAIIKKAYRLANLFHVSDPIASNELGLVILRSIDTWWRRTDTIMRQNRPIIEEWLEGEIRLTCSLPEAGVSVWARLRDSIGSLELTDYLAERHDTAIVPGEYFDAPGYIRIGFGEAQESVKEGLGRISLALDELTR